MRGERDLPAIDPLLCKKCGICVDACPSGAIIEATSDSCAKCIKYCMTMKVPCSPELFVFNYKLCNSCGACRDACLHDAVYWFDAGEHA